MHARIPRATPLEFIGFQRYSLRAIPPQEISRAAKFALKSIPSDSLLSLRNDRRPNDCLNSTVYGQGDAKQEKDRDESEPEGKSLSTSPSFLRALLFCAAANPNRVLALAKKCQKGMTCRRDAETIRIVDETNQRQPLPPNWLTTGSDFGSNRISP